jgi:hypothetical protein
MDVTWRLSFSGRSPGKMAFADMINLSHRPDSNATEYDKAITHDSAELWSQSRFFALPIEN